MANLKATRDGWSPEELKKLGLEPAAVRRSRSAKRQSDSPNNEDS